MLVHKLQNFGGCYSNDTCVIVSFNTNESVQSHKSYCPARTWVSYVLEQWPSARGIVGLL